MSGRTLLLVCGAALLLLGGCAASEKRLSAKEYYTQANEAFAHENFATATDQYRDLLDQYPLNPYAEEAQLKIAYAYYLDKKYAEAVAAFSDFERAYPTSAHLPFVEYYRGMCYLEQMRSIDRDQSVTEKAQEFFRTVTDRYPESPSLALLPPLRRENLVNNRGAFDRYFRHRKKDGVHRIVFHHLSVSNSTSPKVRMS